MAWLHTLIFVQLFALQHYGDYGGVQGNFVVPGLPRKRFEELGDINIGVLAPITLYSTDSLCGGVLNHPFSVIMTQAIAFAAERINEERLLPHNLTLGFVILDDCLKESATAVQSMTFVPQTSCQDSAATPDVQTSYDVVGVIGSTTSPQSVAASQVLGPARVPLISFFSSSDDLSDKRRFPYFLRTLPPDKFQFRGIFSLIQQYGWTYISVVYLVGSYGENGFKKLQDLFNAGGVCLAAVHKVPPRLTEEEATVVAEDLVAHRSARAVVIIANHHVARSVIRATGKLLPAGSFNWIASDAWARSVYSMTELGDLLLDALLVSPVSSFVPEYHDWFLQRKPEETSDPWFKEYWEMLFNCSLDNGTCDTNLSIADSNAFGYNKQATLTDGYILDTVSILANATSRVLSSPDCSDLTGAAARGCVTGPRLLDELRATRQNGYTGWLQLDSNSDRQGRYVVEQVVPGSGGEVFSVVMMAEFDSLTGHLSVARNVSWAHRSLRDGLLHPESRCSYPCGPHEARVVQEVTCCWLCQPCRVNERLILNGTRCDPCPPFTWPDPGHANTTCQAIPPDELRMDSVSGGVQAALALLGLVACLAVFVFFHRHRKCRVIKASSRELSFLMLLAVSLGYIVIMTLLAPPTNFTCRLNFFFFCVSFTLIYGPLLVRTLRIFRIFDASKRSARRPRMIDNSHQLIFSFVLLFIQVVICGTVMAVYPRWHKLTQLNLQDKHVELTCDVPLAGLSAFMAYNLLLVAVCTLLAFKTRHLPDNFNESRFISMCVSTILVILLCFIPAYLVSTRELLKMMTLALVLALNHSVALVFLFLPKIYAVLYLEGAADINATTMHGRNRTFIGTSMERSGIESGTDANDFARRNEVSGSSSRVDFGGSERGGAAQSNSLPVAPNFKQIRPMP